MKKFSDELNELADAESVFADLDRRLPAQIVKMARAYVRRCMRSRVSRSDLDALSASAARELCRANLQQAITEFTAWTPFAMALSPAVGGSIGRRSVDSPVRCR